ncbi:MAG: hypothetical protein JST04_10345 [Bdellovibrionales bacterium]|nr:hypothetical protein [Bdellovibrionales bacterium]
MTISRIRPVRGHTEHDLDLAREDGSGSEFADEIARAITARREREEPRVEPLRRKGRLFSREEIDRELGKTNFSATEVYALRERLRKLRCQIFALKSES